MSNQSNFHVITWHIYFSCHWSQCWRECKLLTIICCFLTLSKYCFNHRELKFILTNFIVNKEFLYCCLSSLCYCMGKILVILNYLTGFLKNCRREVVYRVQVSSIQLHRFVNCKRMIVDTVALFSALTKEDIAPIMFHTNQE